MTTEELKEKIQERLDKERQAFELARKPDRVRLSRTQWYSSQRKTTEITRKIVALETALEILTKPLRDIDVHKTVVMTIPETNSIKEELLRKAESIYLKERREALTQVFSRYLPSLKQQVINHI